MNQAPRFWQLHPTSAAAVLTTGSPPVYAFMHGVAGGKFKIWPRRQRQLGWVNSWELLRNPQHFFSPPRGHCPLLVVPTRC